MRCQKVKTTDLGQVLVPYCWPVIWSNDPADCICSPTAYTKKDQIADLKAKVLELEEEIEILTDQLNAKNGISK